MKYLSVLIKPVSGLCNMKCSYCFYADEMAERSIAFFGKMQNETLEIIMQRIFGEAEEACSIAFQGGEPTLAGLDFYRRCTEYEKKYNTHHISCLFSIQTNGYILNEEWCAFLKENNFLVGISLDGIKATHDCFRKDVKGQDTFIRTMNSIKLLKEYKISFNVLTVVNKRTAIRAGKIYNYYKKNGFDWQQYIACLNPINISEERKELALSPKEYGKFLTELFGMWEADFYNNIQPSIRQFENYVRILAGETPDSCEQSGTCVLQNVIEADGSVYPCDFYVLDDYRLGNICDDSFEEISMRWAACMHTASYAVIDDSCLGCKYYNICRGGCCRNRYSGKNCYCDGYKLFFDNCIERLQLIANICKERLR